MIGLYIGVGIVSVLALLICVYLFVLIRPRRNGKGCEMLKASFAHRGLWGGDIAENTMQAFLAAERAGYGIELDVRLTRDKKLVVFHDATLLRMCGDERRVDEVDYAELCKLSVGGGEGRISLLSDVLTAIQDAPLCIEIKADGLSTEVVAATAELLDGYRGRFCLESFNPFTLSWLRKNRPEWLRGQLFFDLSYDRSGQNKLFMFFGRLMCFNAIARPDFIAYKYQHDYVPALRIVRRLYKTPMVAWTVEDSTEARRVQSRGDGIIFQHFLP